MPINLEYSDCPKCGDPIDDDKEAGDTCDCGYVFPATHEETEEPTEPEEDDITTSDHRKFYQSGKLVLTVDEDDDHVQALKEFMDKEKFWPNCWFISDHGNAHLMDLS